MEYVLLIYTPEAAQDDSDLPKYAAFGQEATAAGVIRGGNRLRPAGEAASVRLRNGEPAITDGPFAETREQLGGYYILDCKSREEALAWAAKVPGARNGTVEVRPVWAMS